MVAAYHLIWSIYGWWLPNDPRGSSSHKIRQDILKELGELHYGRKKIQPTSHMLREFYEKARDLLYHELLIFSDEEILLLGAAFAATIRKHRYTCYACAIMPDHTHLLIRKHRDFAEHMIGHFQDESRAMLIQKQRRKTTHPVWGGCGWKVYLETCDDIERTVRYIEDNPDKAKRPPQSWPFVKRYDGWLPGGRMKS